MANLEEMKPQPPLGTMTREARKLWLASHNAPEDAVLLSVQESDGMLKSLQAANAILQLMRRGENMTIAQTGDYFSQEPDLPNAVGAAVFDALRYKKYADLSEAKLEAVRNLIAAAAKLPGIPAAAAVDLINASAIAKELLDLLVKQRDLRRERIVLGAGAPPPGTQTKGNKVTLFPGRIPLKSKK